MYERHHEPLLSRAEYRRRVLRHAGAAVGILLGSLAIGILGYHFAAGMDWIDALLNASMLLGGMGPVGELHQTAGKLFASVFALYSGVVFLIVASLVVAPVLHRFLHHFHLEMTDEGPAGATKEPAKEPRRKSRS